MVVVSANGVASLTEGQLAAQADGAFAIASGTPVSGPDGNTMGAVGQVVADGSGQIEQILVSVEGMNALLPAGNFSVSGNALVSAMSEGEIRQLAEQQAEESAAK